MKHLFRLGLLLILATAFASRVHAQDESAARDLFNKMLAAQDTKDYDAFVSHGDTQMRAALSRTQFEASSDVLKANQAGGTREITYLGELNQKGYEVYLFRVRFKTGDMLASMTLNKQGEVAGIWFK